MDRCTSYCRHPSACSLALHLLQAQGIMTGGDTGEATEQTALIWESSGVAVAAPPAPGALLQRTPLNYSGAKRLAGGPPALEPDKGHTNPGPVAPPLPVPGKGRHIIITVIIIIDKSKRQK
ncbi:hypothetical protein AAFF_G00187300 [Aldrovandia affinis]|uniref:Uncharacterized protein n=1 Tax=Aldrovandia affinis TaxID=143900 RepID=A0AAD7WVR6_9TELE|nr:hypothetical protein AAFF_G00187300 [Aldrovandia affinis]